MRLAIDFADFHRQDSVFQLDLVILVQLVPKLGFQPVFSIVEIFGGHERTFRHGKSPGARRRQGKQVVSGQSEPRERNGFESSVASTRGKCRAWTQFSRLTSTCGAVR